jgi:hypothetical protein
MAKYIRKEKRCQLSFIRAFNINFNPKQISV